MDRSPEALREGSNPGFFGVCFVCVCLFFFNSNSKHTSRTPCAKFSLREQGYELDRQPRSLLVPRMLIELSPWLWMVPH